MRKISLATRVSTFGLSLLILAGCQGNKPAAPVESGVAPTSSDSSASIPQVKQTDFPTKPITLIVPVNPGGTSDLVTRALAKYSEKYLGQPMVVSNRAGGASTLGTAECVNAKADGYTLVYPPVGAVCVQPFYGQISYTADDMTAISQISEESCVLVVPKDTFKTLEEFIEYGKQNPGAIKYGNSSQGGPVHMVTAKLLSDAKITGESIGYKGAGDVKAALMGGHITSGVLHPSECKPVIDSGDVVALAVSTSTGEREPALPDVPSFKELGYDVTFTVWKGIFAPKDLPEDVKAILEKAFADITADPDFIAEMTAIAQDISYINAADYTEKVKRDTEYYGKVIEEVGMKEIMNGQ